MSIHLNRKEVELYGTCDKCGSKLYCIQVEYGTALCSNPDCEAEETFDPKAKELSM